MKKNKFLKSILFLSLMLFSQLSHALKYVIYTDETNLEHAKKVADKIKSTHPFNKFQLNFMIVSLSTSELKCDFYPEVPTTITCKDKENLQMKTKALGADQAMVVKNDARFGGSSYTGGIPVITKGAPPEAMIHEYLHTLGFCDEYKYEKADADRICASRTSAVNGAFIEPLEGGYFNDYFARASHGSEIPWFAHILESTPITHNKGTRLGTGGIDTKTAQPVNNTQIPMALDAPIGLYKGQICDNASPPRASWHPGNKSTIMLNTTHGLGGALEKLTEEILISKGARLKLDQKSSTNKEALPVNDSGRSAAPKSNVFEAQDRIDERLRTLER